ncbi:MAG: carboxypeptidase-like regulatory domain-containing protein [Thermoguttaceae bacterium]
MTTLLRFATLALLLVSSVGCGKTADPNRPKTVRVTGTVTQAGKPVEGASVAFHAEDNSSGAVGVTDASGNYTLTTFTAGDGAVPGTYQVTITKSDRPAVAPKSDGSVADTGDEAEADDEAADRDSERETAAKNLLPDKYADPKSSGLTATVSESGENKIDFKVD